MIRHHSLPTPRQGFTDITRHVRATLDDSGVEEGLVVVFCTHTTAGLTINENADPDVKTDLLLALERAFPDRPEFVHGEGNSSAHMKASAMGSSVTIPVASGQLVLGTWQGIWFCEFDGPRERSFLVKVMEG